MRLLTKVLPGLLVFALVGCATAPFREDYLVMPSLGDGWKVARSQEERNVRRMTEFVREGETLDNWTELITWQSYKKERTFPSETLVNMQRENIRAMCPGVVWNVIKQQERFLYEWRIANCKPSRAELQRFLKQAEEKRMEFKGDETALSADQHVIALAIEGEWTVWHISYTAKVKELSKEKRAEWIQRFSDTRVETKSR